MEAESDDARYFPLAAQYRRCGLYCVLGAIVLVVLAVWVVKPLVPNRGAGHADPTHFAGLALVVLAAVGLCFLVFRWRLRVDRQGIARRRLFRWHLWPWEAFRRGEVRYGKTAASYVWPKAPFGRRSLFLGLLEEADGDEVNALVHTVWVPPPEPELPETVTVRYGLSSAATLAPGGITLRRWRRRREYRWDEVERLTITVLEHGRPDFQRLQMKLPELSIAWYVHDGNRSWRGAEPEVIAAYVRRHVPEERTLTAAQRGAPRSAEEAEFRLQTWRTKRRELRRFYYAIGAIPAIAAGLCAADLLRLGHLVTVLVGTVPAWSIAYFSDRTVAREQAKIEAWQEQSEAGLAQTPGERPARTGGPLGFPRSLRFSISPGCPSPRGPGSVPMVCHMSRLDVCLTARYK